MLAKKSESEFRSGLTAYNLTLLLGLVLAFVETDQSWTEWLGRALNFFIIGINIHGYICELKRRRPNPSNFNLPPCW
jgi:hypothetical protein